MIDWLIENANIIDGSGAAPYKGDVALENGRIAAVGRLRAPAAAHTLDAAGRTLTPGFVDIHRHGDAALFRPDYGKAELRQGITTVVNGNCGLSCAPVTGDHIPEILRYLAPITGRLPRRQPFGSMEEYLRCAGEVPLALNAGMLAGMGVVRADAAGFAAGDLSGSELQALHRLLERALGDGALGVSLGLGYAPECFYSTRGLIDALAPLRDSGTVIAVHMRQEGDGVTDALEEMLQVARALHTPVEISHLKAIGRRNWGRAVPEMLRRIGEARAQGLDVSCDVYPYTAGSTQLIHVLPPEIQTGGTEALTERLRDPAARAEIRRRMETGTDFENITLLCGFENVRATGLKTPEYRPFEGNSIAQLAQAQGKDPFDALFDLLRAEHCGPSMIDFITAEEDIARILQTPFASVISDAIYPSDGLLHPRVFGMAARMLEHFVGETGTLTLPQAVERMTRRPADRLGLTQKGRIAPGADGDVLVFSPEAVRETASYASPDRYAEGMDWVFVGGVPVIAAGSFTGSTPGRVLRR